METEAILPYQQADFIYRVYDFLLQSILFLFVVTLFFVHGSLLNLFLAHYYCFCQSMFLLSYLLPFASVGFFFRRTDRNLYELLTTFLMGQYVCMCVQQHDERYCLNMQRYKGQQCSQLCFYRLHTIRQNLLS